MPPTIYPTGTTIYEPERCWNGFTVFERGNDALLIDMNGHVINCWEGLKGFPNKLLPGGYIMGSTGERNPKYGFMDNINLIQVDWDGNVVWQFNKWDLITDPGEKPTWMARQHHDYQRDGNPVGYYVPGMEMMVDHGNTLMLCHSTVVKPEISDFPLIDDVFIDVTWDGKVVWEWRCSDHFEELGFSSTAKKVLARNPNIRPINEKVGDWIHINSMSKLGPNTWYDSGDERFHPENIIWSSRQANILAIVEKKMGNIVWKLGPEYKDSLALRNLGQVIGPHHIHMIPRGLPGEGNLLLFDNGGWAGYGALNPGAPSGINNALRDHSRVLEFDPVSLKIVWKYTPREAGFRMPMCGYNFYSPLVGAAQRLPNANTLITEGVGGRLLEVTPECEIVWEYMSPHINKRSDNAASNLIYRVYRSPYDWVPQADKSEEKAIPLLDNSSFRVPGSTSGKLLKTTKVKTNLGQTFDSQFCVLPTDED
jgi:hypothetical protein